MNRLLRPVLAAALLAALPVQAQVSVSLRDVDVRVLIDDVSKATGAAFVIDPRVTGRVSVVSDRPLSRQGYFELFLATLRANGFAAVPLGGGRYRVQPAEAAVAPARPGGDRIVSTVVPLSNIDAASAAETVRPLLSRGGAVTANRAGNAVIIADFADNVARARDALRQVDRDRAAVRVVPLANASARELAQSLTALAGAGEGGRAVVAVIPVEAANAVAIRGDPAQVARFEAVARDLDRRAAAGAEVRVIFLRHADAATVLPVLQTLIGQTPTPAGGPVLGGQAAVNAGTANPSAPVQLSAGGVQAGTAAGAALGVAGQVGNRRAIIARYEGANALIISAPPELQRAFGDVIAQLDRVRPQVHVEAIIVEISDNAARQLGVQFLLSGTDRSAIPLFGTNFSNAAPNLLAITGAIAAERGAITSPTLGQAFQQAAIASLFGSGGQTAPIGGNLGFGTVGSNLIFGAIINAVRNDASSNVLSTPSIMTLDNQPARILVGQEVPITTGEALGQNLNNTFRTTQRQDVGIQLAVKPQINAGGSIKLDIRQIVSSIAGAAGATDLILNKREIETSVTVQDGQIVALGGLLDDNERRSIQRVPLLGDIPVVGELFKSRTRSRVKTNLVVFIRPTIVAGPEEADIIAAQRWDYARRQQVARDGFSTLDAMAREYLCTEPPGGVQCPFIPQPRAPAPPPPPPAPRAGERG